jgi:hypothetical protein
MILRHCAIFTSRRHLAGDRINRNINGLRERGTTLDSRCTQLGWGSWRPSRRISPRCARERVVIRCATDENGVYRYLSGFEWCTGSMSALACSHHVRMQGQISALLHD